MKQKEFFGIGCIENLKQILRKNSVKKIFLVCGKNSFKLSGAENIMNGILDEFEVRNFSQTGDIPGYEIILNGIAKFKDWNCDVVIAVGGGGVIDVGKCINILSAQNGNAEDFIKGINTISNRGKFFIAVPTTAGSGSEATHFAVAYIGKTKFSVAHEYLLPDTAIIDPQFTFKLPPAVTASSGIDAFSQAVESYWSVNSNEESMKYSRKSIGLILENINGAVNNPNQTNRVNMSLAANLAGKAINITKTTAPHALSYSLTSHFGVSHGQAVSLTLGEFLVYNSETGNDDIQGEKSPGELRKNLESLFECLGCKNALEAKKKIEELMKSIGLKTRLTELGISGEENYKMIEDNINLERLQNNPRKLTKENLRKIIANIA